MTRTRRFARMFIRLALPLAATLVVAWPPHSARAACLMGTNYRYYDDQGELCALVDECQGYRWGTCDLDLSYATSTETLVICSYPCH
jgi:hypothetical protein